MAVGIPTEDVGRVLSIVSTAASNTLRASVGMPAARAAHALGAPFERAVRRRDEFVHFGYFKTEVSDEAIPVGVEAVYRSLPVWRVDDRELLRTFLRNWDGQFGTTFAARNAMTEKDKRAIEVSTFGQIVSEMTKESVRKWFK